MAKKKEVEKEVVEIKNDKRKIISNFPIWDEEKKKYIDVIVEVNCIVNSKNLLTDETTIDVFANDNIKHYIVKGV